MYGKAVKLKPPHNLSQMPIFIYIMQVTLSAQKIPLFSKFYLKEHYVAYIPLN